MAMLSPVPWPHVCASGGAVCPGAAWRGASVSSLGACLGVLLCLGLLPAPRTTAVEAREGKTLGKRSTQGREPGTEGGGEETVRHGGPVWRPAASY